MTALLEAIWWSERPGAAGIALALTPSQVRVAEEPQLVP